MCESPFRLVAFADDKPAEKAAQPKDEKKAAFPRLTPPLSEAAANKPAEEKKPADDKKPTDDKKPADKKESREKI